MTHRSPLQTQMRARITAPSRLLLRVGKKFSGEFPVLDAGCGVGRNAIALAELGLNVVCADRDEKRLAKLVGIQPADDSRGALLPICVDLEKKTWPFGLRCFSTIVCVHYRLGSFPLLSFFARFGWPSLY